MRQEKLSKAAGLCLALAIGIVLTATGAAALEDEIILISEVMADPAIDWDGDGTVDAKGDEWIEVMNVADVPVDIGQWWLRDIASEIPDLRLSGVLDPGEAMVFYGSDAMAWQQSQGLTAAGFGLNNTGDFVQLLRSVPDIGAGDLELMYAISYDDHEAEDDRSCGWNEDFTDWILFDGLNPYGGARDPGPTGCLPSPGDPNHCGGQVTVETSSFGRVKTLFR